MGGGGMPGGSTYNSHRSYSSKGAIIGGVAGGAAALGGFLYWRHHNRAKLVGCVQGNGDKLVGIRTIRPTANQQNESLKPGKTGGTVSKKAKDDSGEPTFEVPKMNRDLGQCTATSAENFWDMKLGCCAIPRRRRGRYASKPDLHASRQL